jgi:hypothetical protein
MEVRCQTSFC